jgi:hypothetical protein
MSLAHNTVIFLQNPWFPPETDPAILQSYMHDVQFRRELLATTMTGRRLLSLFGPMYHDIWWDNAHPRPVLGDHRGVGDPDHEHMLHVILERRPKTIGLLGRRAAAGMNRLSREVPLFFQGDRMLGARIVTARHPNAMGCTTEELERFSNIVINRAIGCVGV